MTKKKTTKKKVQAKPRSGNKKAYLNSSFTPGNQLWRKGTFKPVPRIYEDPIELYNLCVEYFEEVESNPLYKTHVSNYKGMIDTTEVPVMRVMTQQGLCLHLGISDRVWRRWIKEPKKGNEEVLAVQEWAETVIRQQKFEGAAAGLLNPIIIAKDLGLKDKIVTEDEEGNDAPITGPVLILPSNGREVTDPKNEA